MNRIILTLSALALAAMPALACTGLIATPGATADSSTLATYAADSHVLYGELYNRPAADHPKGAMRKVVEWDTGKHMGEIPEVPHTYRTIGNMNEHGLYISESTWGGRPELVDTTGIIDYGSLIYIALERAKTAREAIKVMTDLVKDYGYASSGESFTIADPKEAWIMEMIGKGPGRKGAVWVARRIPDGYISGHANYPRIHQFPLKDKAKETIYEPETIKLAKEKGYFTGKDKDFDFCLAYGELDYGELRGCDARVWSYFNMMAPGEVDQYLPYILEGKGEAFPLWIKPSKKITAQDMKRAMRDHFEGTPLDMTKDVGAGPFHVPYRWRPMDYEVDGKKYTHERAIATQQTGFSLVADLNEKRPAGTEGILWFGCDDADFGAYIPIFSGTPKAPHEVEVGNGDMDNLSWDALFWVNNYVANQAYHRYSRMIPDIRRVQGALETAMEADAAAAAQAVKGMDKAEREAYLQQVSDKWAKKVTDDYKALGDYLFVKYMDGNIKPETEPGKFATTPEGMPASPKFGGYDDQRYFDAIVKETGDHFRVLDKGELSTPL